MFVCTISLHYKHNAASQRCMCFSPNITITTSPINGATISNNFCNKYSFGFSTKNIAKRVHIFVVYT